MEKQLHIPVMPDKLEKDEYLSIVQYYRYLRPHTDRMGAGILAVNIETGQETFLSNTVVEACLNSSSHYVHEEKVTRSELARRLMHAHDAVFTVTFTKKNGSERTMVAHLIDVEDFMGRSRVYDLEQKGIRQIDHRTISSLIWKGTRYHI